MVVPVTSLRNSSSVYPTASLAAILAMGNPVALDAKADERLTRGFISTTSISAVSGFTQNCTFAPPSVHAHFAQDGKRGISHALIFAVGQCLDWGHRDGITGVHPHGINILNAAHNDAVVPSIPHHFEFVFLPAKHRLVDLHLTDHGSRQTASHDVLELGLVPRNPSTKAPKVNAGRTINGRPTSSKNDWASDMDSTVRALGNFRPSFSTTFRKACRSSARWMTSRSAIISTLNSVSTPSSCSWQAQFNAVCPPKVGSRHQWVCHVPVPVPNLADAGHRDRLDVRTVGNSGSVMMVAGLEFTNTTR